jgi:glycosyltransferase involved in cell wall biosynthesis
MRVGLLVATSDRTGVETHLRVLALGLTRIGVEPILVCPRPGPLTEALAADGIEVRCEAPRRRAGLSELGRLRRALADVDLIHAHGPRALWWSALLRRFLLRLPAVGSVHEFELTGRDEAWRRAVYLPLERWAFRSHDALVAVSEDLVKRVVGAGVVAPEAIEVVPNSSPLLLDPPMPVEARPHVERVVVVARLDRVKGIDVLIDAWGELARGGGAPRLAIVGDGVERAALEARRRERGLAELVEFVGAVPDVRPALRAADAYVAPSRMEGLPASVLEAMAFGLPVVATAVGGHHDLLGAVAPEWLVPVEDSHALAAKLRELVARSAEERTRWGRSLQEVAYERFHPTVLARRTAAVYARVLERGGARVGGGTQREAGTKSPGAPANL